MGEGGRDPGLQDTGGRLRFRRESLLDFLRRYHFPIPSELAQGRSRVLAVDDDPSCLARVKRALDRSFDVVTYGDPYDALLGFGGEKPDAIVMDAKMPALDTVRCFNRIRA